MKRKSRRSLNVLGRWVWVPIFLIGVAGLTAEALAAEALPPLPEGIASFGAAVAGDYLYVYGGHIGQTHEHSVENLSRGFRRLNLGNSGRGWEDLGEVAGLQGVALVAHGGKVYKVGGMTADNHKGGRAPLSGGSGLLRPRDRCLDLFASIARSPLFPRRRGGG